MFRKKSIMNFAADRQVIVIAREDYYAGKIVSKRFAFSFETCNLHLWNHLNPGIYNSFL